MRYSSLPQTQLACCELTIESSRLLLWQGFTLVRAAWSEIMRWNWREVAEKHSFCWFNPTSLESSPGWSRVHVDASIGSRQRQTVSRVNIYNAQNTWNYDAYACMLHICWFFTIIAWTYSQIAFYVQFCTIPILHNNLSQSRCHSASRLVYQQRWHSLFVPFPSILRFSLKNRAQTSQSTRSFWQRAARRAWKLKSDGNAGEIVGLFAVVGRSWRIIINHMASSKAALSGKWVETTEKNK